MGARFLTPSFQISTPDRIIVITVLAVYLLTTGSKAMLAFEDWRNVIARMVFNWTYEVASQAPLNIATNPPGAPLDCKSNPKGCRGYHVALAYLYAQESDLGKAITPPGFQEKYFSAGGSSVNVLELFKVTFSSDYRNQLLSKMMGGPGRMLEGLAISFAAILESFLAFILSLNAILLFIALPVAVGFAVFTPFGGGLSATIMQGVEVIKTSAMVGLVLGIIMGFQVRFQDTPLVAIGINFIAGMVYWGLIGQAWKLLGTTFSVTSGAVTSTVGTLASPVTDAAKEGMSNTASGAWNTGKMFVPALGGVEWAAKNPQQAGMLAGAAVGSSMGNPFAGAQVGSMVGSAVASRGQGDSSPVPGMAGQMLIMKNATGQAAQGASAATPNAEGISRNASANTNAPVANTNAASALTRGYQAATTTKNPDAKQSAFRMFDEAQLPKQRAGQAFALVRDAQDANIPASDFERMVNSVARGDRNGATKIATTYVGAQNAEQMVNRAARIAGQARVERWSSPPPSGTTAKAMRQQ